MGNLWDLSAAASQIYGSKISHFQTIKQRTLNLQTAPRKHITVKTQEAETSTSHYGAAREREEPFLLPASQRGEKVLRGDK